MKVAIAEDGPVITFTIKSTFQDPLKDLKHFF